MRTIDDDPTDGTDAHWEWLHPMRPERTWRPGGPGRPPGDVRRRRNGLLSRNQTGGQGRLVPKALGHWSPIEGSCPRWRRDGVWVRVLETRRQGARRWLGRQPAPAAGRRDSPRLKTAPPREDVGVDGHNKLTGRQRPSLVATLGLSMAVVVTSAATEARRGWVAWLRQSGAAGVTRRRHIWVEGASPAAWLEAWGRGVQPTHTIAVEATTHQEGKGCHVLPWRWAVARTFAWRRNDRRPSRDAERLTTHSAAMSQMSLIRLLLNRWT